MRLILFACAVSQLIMAGCVMNPKAGVDPFKDYGKADPYFESECTVKANNGECVKATCKEDAVSNCDDWVAGCLNHDGYFQGSSAGGTCSKIL
ncbi:MAG TPA: hypothetical protein VNV18_11425 [Stellaceae bacterium]|jgi:hypothetical protein|nr:hypothetical protein [Stellaceae bacterium]